MLASMILSSTIFKSGGRIGGALKVKGDDSG